MKSKEVSEGVCKDPMSLGKVPSIELKSSLLAAVVDVKFITDHLNV